MEDIERKSFVFYLNWKDQIAELDDQELRRFINNLINYHQGEEVALETKIDRIIWQGILPALKVNDEKYVNKFEANRENGKYGALSVSISTLFSPNRSGTKSSACCHHRGSL